MGKERRNFLLLSILIILNRYAEVDLNEIEILGNTIFIEDPSVIGFILILTWFYFGLRFYQQCYSDSKFLNNLKSVFIDKILYYGREKIKSYIIQNNENTETEWDITKQYKNEKIESFGFTSFTLILSKQDGTGGIVDSDPYEIPIKYLIFPFSRSSLYILLNNKNFSTYFFPFLLAFFALISLVA